MDMKKLLFLIFLSLFPIWNANADNLPNLFQVEVPVGSQLSDERGPAVRDAFSQLMVRLTGNPDIDKNAVIKEASKRAEYYVQEFSYSAPTMMSATYTLNVTFDEDDVKRLINKAGVPFWGEKRPLILVWLIVTDANHDTEIIGNETPGDIPDAFRIQSKKFALPMIFPLMDVTDMSQVSPEEVGKMSLPALIQAGKRYAPNAYLVGRIETVSDGFQSHWELVMGKNQWSWSITDKTTDAMIAEVLYQTSQTLSQYFNERSG